MIMPLHYLTEGSDKKTESGSQADILKRCTSFKYDQYN